MRNIFIIAVLLFCSSSFAQYGLGAPRLVAPTIPDVSVATVKSVGTIVFDASDNSFKGYDINGQWQTFAAASADRTVHVRFGGPTDFTACTSSPCTIYSQSGSWVTSVEIGVNAAYEINIAPGTFTERPTCTCSAQDPGSSHQSCGVSANGDENQVDVAAVNVGTATTVSTGYFEVICVGH